MRGWLRSTLTLCPATNVITITFGSIAWTLNYEILFYLVMAILLAKPILLRYVLFLYVIAFYLRSNVPVFQYFGNPMNLEFIIGTTLSNLPRFDKGRILVPIGFVFLAIAGYFDGTWSLNALQNGNESLRVLVRTSENVERN